MTRIILAVVILIFGLALAAGGIQLILLGGSWGYCTHRCAPAGLGGTAVPT